MATATTAIEPNVKISATKLLINGQWVSSTSGKTFPTINPSTGASLVQVGEPHCCAPTRQDQSRKARGLLFALRSSLAPTSPQVYDALSTSVRTQRSK